MRIAPLLVLAALAVVGCKKKTDQPVQQAGYGQCGGYNQPPCGTPPASTCGGYNQPACAPPPPPPPTATAAPTCGGVGQAPCQGAAAPPVNPGQALISGFLSATAAAVGTLAGGDAMQVKGGIELKAREDAKGMRADGQLFSATLTQGSHAEASVTLQPGKCYTVVGFGGFGVMRFQLNLIAPLPAPVILAQSRDDGPAPTLAPGDQCYRSPSPVPVPAKIDMYLLQGQGVVGAQLFSK